MHPVRGPLVAETGNPVHIKLSVVIQVIIGITVLFPEFGITVDIVPGIHYFRSNGYCCKSHLDGSRSIFPFEVQIHLVTRVVVPQVPEYPDPKDQYYCCNPPGYP